MRAGMRSKFKDKLLVDLYYISTSIDLVHDCIVSLSCY